MAKSNKSKPAPKTAGKSAKSAKPAGMAAEVEVVEEKQGIGIEGGLAIVTTLALIGAILVIDYSLAGYGAATFFK